jgi:two-component system, cell cycle response regulator
MTKILVVEDSKFLRATMERVLAKAGYAISSADDGEAALRKAQEILPDLILLDMLLPKMSGEQVLMALKKNPLTQAIPVMVVTRLHEKNSARLQADGAVGFYEKEDLALEQGSRRLLAAVEEVLKKFPKGARSTSAQ